MPQEKFKVNPIDTSKTKVWNIDKTVPFPIMETPELITKEKLIKLEASTRQQTLQTSESAYHLTEELPSVERRTRKFITEESPLITEQSYIRPQFTKQRNNIWNDDFSNLDEKVKDYIKKLEYKKELEAQILEKSLKKKHDEEIQGFEEKMEEMRSAYKRLLDVFIKGVTHKYSRPNLNNSRKYLGKDDSGLGTSMNITHKPRIPQDIFSPLRREDGDLSRVEDSHNNTLNNSKYHERKIRVLPGKFLKKIILYLLL